MKKANEKYADQVRQAAENNANEATKIEEEKEEAAAAKMKKKIEKAAAKIAKKTVAKKTVAKIEKENDWESNVYPLAFVTGARKFTPSNKSSPSRTDRNMNAEYISSYNSIIPGELCFVQRSSLSDSSVRATVKFYLERYKRLFLKPGDESKRLQVKENSGLFESLCLLDFNTTHNFTVKAITVIVSDHDYDEEEQEAAKNQNTTSRHADNTALSGIFVSVSEHKSQIIFTQMEKTLGIAPTYPFSSYVPKQNTNTVPVEYPPGINTLFSNGVHSNSIQMNPNGYMHESTADGPRIFIRLLFSGGEDKTKSLNPPSAKEILDLMEYAIEHFRPGKLFACPRTTRKVIAL